MLTQICVDTNAGEARLWEALEALAPAGITLKHARLDVGDVEVTTPAGRLLLERKTWPDLLSSLARTPSGCRWEDQKARLLAADVLLRGYLIDASAVPPWDEGHAALAMAQQDGFVVLWSADAFSMAHQVVQLCRKALDGRLLREDRAAAFEARGGQAAALVGSKKRARAALSGLELFLPCVDRCTVPAARAVASAFPTVAALAQAYRKCSSEKEGRALLADLQVGKRRLGPALSAAIWERFHA